MMPQGCRSAQNLYGVQAATGEIGTERALAEWPMAVLARMLRTFPIGLAVCGITHQRGCATTRLRGERGTRHKGKRE